MARLCRLAVADAAGGGSPAAAAPPRCASCSRTQSGGITKACNQEAVTQRQAAHKSRHSLSPLAAPERSLPLPLSPSIAAALPVGASFRRFPKREELAGGAGASGGTSRGRRP